MMRDMNVTKKRTFYRQLDVAKRREMKAMLLKQVSLRKQQIEMYENAFIKPNRQLIALTDSVLKNEVAIEDLLRESKRWEQFIKKLMNHFQKEL